MPCGHTMTTSFLNKLLTTCSSQRSDHWNPSHFLDHSSHTSLCRALFQEQGHSPLGTKVPGVKELTLAGAEG